MKKKICLVIIYNHNFERNISVLNRIYAGRFSHVYHVMPFYRGDDPKVIGVYENSYQFSGYITQFYLQLGKHDFSSFVFVADDMVINPSINENNILERLGSENAQAFITGAKLIEEEKAFCKWGSALGAFRNFSSRNNACEFLRQLPSIEEATRLMTNHGFDCSKGVTERMLRIATYCVRAQPYAYAGLRPYLISSFALKHPRWFSSGKKLYPLLYGYSDFLMVSAEKMPDFIHLCGVFAAARIFVEVAIPTALYLCCDKVKTVADIGVKCEIGVSDYSVRDYLEKKYEFSFKRLTENFPEDYLFIHSVKLSRWKDLP